VEAAAGPGEAARKQLLRVSSSSETLPDQMQNRDMARDLAFGRIAVGASALLTTKLFGLIFAGREAAEDPVTRMAGRLFGVRTSPSVC
jgi:hypothetical protein